MEWRTFLFNRKKTGCGKVGRFRYFWKIEIADSNSATQTKKIFMKEFNEFLELYNAESDLIAKLMMVHEFIHKYFDKDKDLGFKIVKEFLIYFNDPKFNLSEIKTVLVISKSFKENPLMKEEREKLLETYNNKKS